MVVADLLVPSRRGFLAGLGASLLAAPAIVRAASFMPVKALDVSLRTMASYAVTDQPIDRLDVLYGSMHVKPNWLTIHEITREAVRLFKNSNQFIQNIDTQYAADFEFAKADGVDGWQWRGEFVKPNPGAGSTLRIRLPSDYHVRN